MSVVIVRVKAGMPCPEGFSEGMSTRRTKICFKHTSNASADIAAAAAALPAPEVAPPQDPSIDDLTGLLGAMTMNMPYAVDVDQISSLMGAMHMSGKGRKRRMTRKMRKSMRRRRL